MAALASLSAAFLPCLLSAVTLLPASVTAPACQGALPHHPPCLGFCLPHSSYSWLSNPSGCRGGGAELSSCSCPDRPWGLLLMAMPCAQDHSCFEERSCQSGLGLLSARGVGGWEGCAFPHLHSCPPAWNLRARPPSSCCRSPLHARPQQSGQCFWGMAGARCPCWHTGLAEPVRLGQGWDSGSVPQEWGPCWHPHTGTAALLWVHLPPCGARCYATAGS